MFLEKKIGGKTVVYSDLIPELEHFFTTRESTLDNEENKELTAKYLGIDVNNLINPTQTHSTNVEVAQLDRSDYPQTDGLILTNKEQAIYLRFADCVPVIIYSKRFNIAAIAHAGWRGTAGGIVKKTIQKIWQITDTVDTQDIYAVIGPAISICCYTVGQEVTDGIKTSVENHEGLFRKEFDKTYVDLKLANARQIEELGIAKTNIDICPYCTSCQNDMFFSYRKENSTTSRHNAVIKLR